MIEMIVTALKLAVLFAIIGIVIDAGGNKED